MDRREALRSGGGFLPAAVSYPGGGAGSLVGPSVRQVRFTVTGFGAWFDSTASIDYRVRYSCTYAGATVEACRSWTLTYSYDGAFFGSGSGWNGTPSISGPGSSCP